MNNADCWSCLVKITKLLCLRARAVEKFGSDVLGPIDIQKITRFWQARREVRMEPLTRRCSAMGFLLASTCKRCA